MKKALIIASALSISILLGCATIQITTEIITEPPGANIEINGEYIGKSPCFVTFPANYKGEFIRSATIRALPVMPGHYLQSKYFAGGYGFNLSDFIPKKIFFDMRLGPILPDINLNITE